MLQKQKLCSHSIAKLFRSSACMRSVNEALKNVSNLLAVPFEICTPLWRTHCLFSTEVYDLESTLYYVMNCCIVHRGVWITNGIADCYDSDMLVLLSAEFWIREYIEFDIMMKVCVCKRALIKVNITPWFRLSWSETLLPCKLMKNGSGNHCGNLKSG